MVDRIWYSMYLHDMFVCIDSTKPRATDTDASSPHVRCAAAHLPDTPPIHHSGRLRTLDVEAYGLRPDGSDGLPAAPGHGQPISTAAAATTTATATAATSRPAAAAPAPARAPVRVGRPQAPPPGPAHPAAAEPQHAPPAPAHRRHGGAVAHERSPCAHAAPGEEEPHKHPLDRRRGAAPEEHA